jgi:ABC-type nitrate/sulfonate/bicarbonate transport system substrate-binding protein
LGAVLMWWQFRRSFAAEIGGKGKDDMSCCRRVSKDFKVNRLISMAIAMRTLSILSLLALALALAATVLGEPAPTDQGQARIELVYCKGQSLLPMLLATNQIDGYVAWQPCLAIAEEGGIGKVVAYSQDFPPLGTWKNHPCCVLVASGDLLGEDPELVSCLAALIMISTNWVNDNPREAVQISREWLMGDRNYSLGSTSLPSQQVFLKSFSTFRFSSRPDQAWVRSCQALVSCMTDLLNTTEGLQTRHLNLSSFYDLQPYGRAEEAVNKTRRFILSPRERRIRVGYLMIDHQAPLFVAIRRWRQLQEGYGIALRSQNEEMKRPGLFDLLVEGEKVAEVELVATATGQTMMVLMEQDCLDMALVGITPALGAISLGCDAKIIMPMQNEGSGLVMAADSPARDWSGFVELAEARYRQGRPLKIADPDLGTIADVLFQSALRESGIVGVRAG